MSTTLKSGNLRGMIAAALCGTMAMTIIGCDQTTITQGGSNNGNGGLAAHRVLRRPPLC